MLIELRAVSTYHTSVWVVEETKEELGVSPGWYLGLWWTESFLVGKGVCSPRWSNRTQHRGCRGEGSAELVFWVWGKTWCKQGRGEAEGPEDTGWAILWWGCPGSPLEAHLGDIQEQMAKKRKTWQWRGVRQAWKQLVLVQPLAGLFLRSLRTGPILDGQRRGGASPGWGQSLASGSCWNTRSLLAQVLPLPHWVCPKGKTDTAGERKPLSRRQP